VPRQPRQERKVEVLGLLGIGLDHEDGHHRQTEGTNFFLVGGSETTHERMLEAAIHLNEELRKRGKDLREATGEEIRDLLLEELAP
jgi:hypothetical protein